MLFQSVLSHLFQVVQSYYLCCSSQSCHIICVVPSVPSSKFSHIICVVPVSLVPSVPSSSVILFVLFQSVLSHLFQVVQSYYLCCSSLVPSVPSHIICVVPVSLVPSVPSSSVILFVLFQSVLSQSVLSHLFQVVQSYYLCCSSQSCPICSK